MKHKAYIIVLLNIFAALCACEDDLYVGDGTTASDDAPGVYIQFSVGGYNTLGANTTTRATTETTASWTESDLVYDTNAAGSDTTLTEASSWTYTTTTPPSGITSYTKVENDTTTYYSDQNHTTATGWISTTTNDTTTYTYTYTYGTTTYTTTGWISTTDTDGTTTYAYTYTNTWDLTWDETYVYNVDLLLFRAAVSENGDTLYYLRHVQSVTSPKFNSNGTYTVQMTETDGTAWVYEDILDTDILYLIANHTFANSDDTYGYYSSSDISSVFNAASSDQNYSTVSSTDNEITLLSSLKDLTTNELTTDYPRGPLGKYLGNYIAKYRYPFEMSARIGAGDYQKGYDEYGVTTKKLYYNVVLERALAKLLIHVYFKDSEASDYTEFTTAYQYNQGEHDIRFMLNNYATQAALIPDGDYLPTVANADEDEYALSDEGDSSLSDDARHQKMDFLYTYLNTAGNAIESTAAVFYFYPNQWVDEEELTSTYGLSTDQPIDESRQTFVSMTLKHYQGENRWTEYMYRIPVNYLLPEDNDLAGYGTDYYDDVAAYYRIDRNTLYEVSVYITEIDAGLRVSLSTGRGASAEIANLTDDAEGSITIEPDEAISFTADSDDSLIEDLIDADTDMGDNTDTGTVEDSGTSERGRRR